MGYALIDPAEKPPTNLLGRMLQALGVRYETLMVVAMICIVSAGARREINLVGHGLQDVAGRLAELEARHDRGTAHVLDRIHTRLHSLERRVDFPKFTRHTKHCPQCRGDVPNAEDGGPSALCGRGFAILKEEMADNEETP